MMDGLVAEFELRRPRLRAVAYRMLGSAAEADDAVQEAWLRLDRAGPDGIDDLEAWLVTVVGRVCLDMLRSRSSRREVFEAPTPGLEQETSGPEQDVELADSVGLALVVVLETLSPTERLAFVLHDMFGVSFDEIAPIVGRSSSAARQLASRARRRVRGSAEPDAGASREIVEAFLRAARGGEVETLLTLLDPDVRLRSMVPGAEQISSAADVARFFAGRAQSARPALIDGSIGVAVLNAAGEPWILMRLTFAADRRIASLEAVTGDAITDFEVSVLSEPAL